MVTYDELIEQGIAARTRVPRSAHRVYTPDPKRDPLGILARQHESRLPDLVPLRIERMLQDPFSFYRGTAALQAADLATETVTGVNLCICGDAHIANFGLFASPQRTMVFDLNDFDEAAFGPWEWDVKRFVTSVIIAAQHKGRSVKQTYATAMHAAAAYRVDLRQMFDLSAVERYYVRADVKASDPRFHPSWQKVINQALKGAKRRTSERAIRKITRRAADGTLTIVEDPPTLMHADVGDEREVAQIVDQYRATLPPDVSVLLSQYTATDVVRRVVGVGSVGTRCYIVVMTGARGEPLVLQVKEATDSALTTFGVAPASLPPGTHGPTDHNGYRVVANQRILQAVSDPFLGYIEVHEHTYYVRQFRDGNVSIDAADLEPRVFNEYVEACGTALARAHSQSPNAAFIAGYLGDKPKFDEAVVRWGLAYARQSNEDYHALRKASPTLHERDS
ncbi:uncharacterized protein (DUF2252 family) [Antricoccus suffuscus]|uniref:Uncharacterized protein (DUF2252 family) n=1 Tax=Antricoccus suffuscus TaxID=1629062 RepID=A0A2T1A176_9ACTN|nr:DUF2252 domain-containing protein [Antricoccus suffuscus]PRZ42284.1 uncharacterized protein (DUF2252 family) [Antricoccus suffuscus]